MSYWIEGSCRRIKGRIKGSESLKFDDTDIVIQRVNPSNRTLTKINGSDPLILDALILERNSKDSCLRRLRTSRPAIGGACLRSE
jgi:hypothetical protein